MNKILISFGVVLLIALIGAYFYRESENKEALRLVTLSKTYSRIGSYDEASALLNNAIVKWISDYVKSDIKSELAHIESAKSSQKTLGETTDKKSPSPIPPSPSQMPKIVIPTPTKELNKPNLADLCQADANSLKSQATLQIDQNLRQEILDHPEIYNDPYMGAAAYTKLADLKQQAEVNVNSETSRMVVWCLDHNRDYSGFEIQSNYIF